jgi:serine/threonine protein kinase
MYDAGILFEAIKEHEIDFSIRSWQRVSREGMVFTQRLLQRDPTRRPTAAEALQDPWLVEQSSLDPQIAGVSAKLSTSVVQRLQRYNNYSRFKRVALGRVMHAMVADPNRPQVIDRKDSPL